MIIVIGRYNQGMFNIFINITQYMFGFRTKYSGSMEKKSDLRFECDLIAFNK